MTVLNAVAVLFLVVLAGALARKLHIMTDEMIHGTTRLVTAVTLPCLTLQKMQQPFSREVLSAFLLTLAVSLAVILLSIGVGWLIFSGRPRARRVVLANFCGFSNCGFMGLPIIEAVNPAWMIYAVAYNIAYNLVAWTLAIGMFAGREGLSAKKILLNVNIIASAVGFGLFCANFTWPSVIDRALGLVGGLTTPLSMLLIGARICGIRPAEMKDPDYHIITLLRNLALPLATLLILMALPLPPEIRKVVFLLTAMPLGTLIAMMAELHHCDAAFSARAVAWTTLFSLGTVPLLSLLMDLAL